MRCIADRPAAVDVADNPFAVDPDVVEEHFGQFAAATCQRDRPDGDPGRVGIDHEHRQSAVAAFGRTGTYQREQPGGRRPLAGPDLLAVDDEAAVAIGDCAGAQRGEVAAGLRLGEALAPPFGAAEVAGQVGGGQTGSESEQGGAQGLQRPVLRRYRQHRVAEFFVVHGPVDFVPAEAAGRLRPAIPIPAVGVQPRHHLRVVGQAVLGAGERGRAPFLRRFQVAKVTPEVLAVGRDVGYVVESATTVNGAVDRGGQPTPLHGCPDPGACQNPLNS